LARTRRPRSSARSRPGGYSPKYKSKRIQPKQFAGVVDSLGRQFGEAFLVIEKNMHGITVLRALRDDHSTR
jgi:hypothetical protein